ncbi:unnamed protein product (macronuclear) [Paramecium tetraurelia]|uniref:HTH psq-type domain-containing protein n=1 Tax=Paramecium tetraurelia TaxID=5888 RepID=A0CZP8_PARTE|nr:uncharacterized protein GSPATT00011838001 [Paramecium tetraurelia]CAK76265.1 unnamed protein product [Paramecium tetraurelia]|eukprot:XP_001443662.1 hypothetical protein (macronuclear) [Paramecium tetraurelia strain d4-2]
MQNTDQESSINNSIAKEQEQQNFVKNKKNTKKSSRRIHKIPIRTQQLLFVQVFQEGKSIKQVADDLKLNYSSAKSLIHYYKNHKRPAPNQVVDVLNGKKPCLYKNMQNNQNAYNNLKIEVWLKHSFIKAYNFYERLRKQEQRFASQCLS